MLKRLGSKLKTDSHTTGQSKRTCKTCKKSLALTRFELDKRNNKRLWNCIACRNSGKNKKMTESPYAYLNHLYSQLKYRRKKTHDFTITNDYLHYLWRKHKGVCRYSGKQMTHIKDGTGYHLGNVSIDRIDNTKGYVKGNIALVCLAINMMKYTLELKELIEWCKLIATNNKD